MDCPVSPDVSFGAWSDALVARLRGGRYPLSATFEITERCNLACIHCFINQPAGSRAALARELSLAEVRRIIDELAEAGCISLLLTGGEVLVRRDFADIYHHARRAGLLVMVFTNATLLTPRIADVLAEWPSRLVEVTLYGATQETYEQVTRVPGSFARFRRGLELLLDRGLRVGLKAVILTANRHELAAMKDLARRHDIQFRYDGALWPRIDGGQEPFACRLSPEEAVALDRDDEERWARWLQAHDTLSGRMTRSERVYSCSAALHSCHIDASGHLGVCMMVRDPAHDLREQSFQQAWERLGAERLAKRQLESACQTCTLGILCSQCPGWSYMVHGDKETPVDYLCRVGHLRAAHIVSPQP